VAGDDPFDQAGELLERVALLGEIGEPIVGRLDRGQRMR
jgi:hypothetical protein